MKVFKGGDLKPWVDPQDYARIQSAHAASNLNEAPYRDLQERRAKNPHILALQAQTLAEQAQNLTSEIRNHPKFSKLRNIENKLVRLHSSVAEQQDFLPGMSEDSKKLASERTNIIKEIESFCFAILSLNRGPESYRIPAGADQKLYQNLIEVVLDIKKNGKIKDELWAFDSDEELSDSESSQKVDEDSTEDLDMQELCKFSSACSIAPPKLTTSPLKFKPQVSNVHPEVVSVSSSLITPSFGSTPPPRKESTFTHFAIGTTNNTFAKQQTPTWDSSETKIKIELKNVQDARTAVNKSFQNLPMQQQFQSLADLPPLPPSPPKDRNANTQYDEEGDVTFETSPSAPSAPTQAPSVPSSGLEREFVTPQFDSKSRKRKETNFEANGKNSTPARPLIKPKVQRSLTSNSNANE